MYEVVLKDGRHERFEEPGSQDIALRMDFQEGACIIFEELLIVPTTPHVLAAYAPGTWDEVHWISEQEELK